MLDLAALRIPKGTFVKIIFFGSVKFSHLLEFVRGCSYLDKKLWPKKYYPHLGSKIAYFYSSVLDKKMHFS